VQRDQQAQLVQLVQLVLALQFMDLTKTTPRLLQRTLLVNQERDILLIAEIFMCGVLKLLTGKTLEI
jgi:hypothetical protein